MLHLNGVQPAVLVGHTLVCFARIAFRILLESSQSDFSPISPTCLVCHLLTTLLGSLRQSTMFELKCGLRRHRRSCTRNLHEEEPKVFQYRLMYYVFYLCLIIDIYIIPFRNITPLADRGSYCEELRAT